MESPSALLSYTVADFVAAYEATGLKPLRSSYVLAAEAESTGPLTCGCPITALIAHKFPDPLARLRCAGGGTPAAAAARILGVPEPEIVFFTQGVDGYPGYGKVEIFTRTGQLRALGHEVWRAVQRFDPDAEIISEISA